MKKAILVIICITLASNIAAQQYLNKYLRGEVGTESLIKQAIENSVVIVKQSYQVKNKKTGNVYGRNGRNDFGHSYSIAVKTEAGLILTDLALKPWLYDDAFKKVEQNYEPLVSLTEIRDMETDSISAFTQCPLKIERQQPEGLWVANTENSASGDMEIDVETGSKDGWLIWYVAKENLDTTPNAEISIQAINKKIEIESGETNMDIDSPDNVNQVLGGIYVCPAYLGGGHVAYRLVGMVVKEDEKWKLRTPFVGYTYEKAVTAKEQNEPSPKEENVQKEEEQDEIDLTPIEQDQKKKKKNKK